MDGQPGDKSPGYYRVALRDEVKTGFQMSKLQGPKGRGMTGAKYVQIAGPLSVSSGTGFGRRQKGQMLRNYLTSPVWWHGRGALPLNVPKETKLVTRSCG